MKKYKVIQVTNTKDGNLQFEIDTPELWLVGEISGDDKVHVSGVEVRKRKIEPRIDPDGDQEGF